jgi:excisionase family DNA binding protein
LSLVLKPMPQMMTIKELAEYLRLHVTTVRKYAAQCRIPGVRIGKIWRFDKNTIDEWIGWDQNKSGVREGEQVSNIFMRPKG